MDSSQLSTRAHTLITAVLSYIGFIAAYFIRFYLMPGVINYSFTLYSLMGLTSALLHYVIYSLFFYSQMNLYRRYTRLVQRTVLCEILCVGLTLAALFLINLPLVSRMAVFISGVLDTVFICAKHYVVLRAYTALHRSGIYRPSSGGLCRRVDVRTGQHASGRLRRSGIRACRDAGGRGHHCPARARIHPSGSHHLPVRKIRRAAAHHSLL